MTRDLLEGILSKITELDNSNTYDITLTPINEEEIDLEMSNEEYAISRNRPAWFRVIKKRINIHEPINLQL